MRDMMVLQLRTWIAQIARHKGTKAFDEDLLVNLRAALRKIPKRDHEALRKLDAILRNIARQFHTEVATIAAG